jgi:hypothetical protein
MQLNLLDDDRVIHVGNVYSVAEITRDKYLPYFLEIHYARRVPSVTYAYGLFENNALVGVVTYGTPASSTLCRGVCGDEWQRDVIELNRLVLRNNKPNEASRLIGGSFRLLPKPKIVVSFADTAQDHLGIVYQATNFLYTGLSARFRDPKVRGLEHQHHATYARGMNHAQLIEKFGIENVYYVERSRKHRYIHFVGNKKQVREMRAALRYELLPYPNTRSDASASSLS